MFKGRVTSFSGKVTLLATVSSGVAVLVMASVLLVFQYVELRPSAVARLAPVADAIEGESGILLDIGESYQEEQEEVLGRVLRGTPNLLAARVYDAEGELFAQRQLPDLELSLPAAAPRPGHWLEGAHLYLARQIRYESRSLGTLLLVQDVRPAYLQLWRNAYVSVLVGLIAMGGAYLMSLRLQRMLAAPVAELAATARRVSLTQNFGMRATHYSDDELGELTRAFNDMLGRIQVRDLELKEAQAALGHSEERSRKIVDTALDAVITMDASGIITGWNAQAEKTFGWMTTEAVGRPMTQMVIPARHHQAYNERIQRFLTSGDGRLVNRRLEMTALRRNGEEFPVEVAISAIQLEHTVHFSTFIQDITERKRSEEALRDREARFRAVVDTAADGIITINDRGTIEFANPAVENIFGYSHAELIGRNVNLLMPEPDHSQHDGYIAKYLKTGEAHIIGIGREVNGRRKDGSLFPMHLSIATFMLGGKRYFTGITHDLTRRKETEELLARERSLLRALVDTAPDCIYVKDRDGRFLMNNPAHLRTLGAASQEQAVGRTDFDFFPRTLAERYQADDQRIIRTGQPLLNREEPVVDSSGRLRWFATSKIPLLDDEGRTGRLVGISRDITDLRQAMEQLETTNTELQQKNQEMEQFVYTVSHDLKSPIVTCVGFLGLMKEDIGVGRYQDLEDSMKRLERAVGRMHQSINDLLELSRIGRVRSEPEQIDVDRLLHEMAEDMGPRLKDKGIELSIQPDLPQVIADRTRVLEVFENLMTNAIKYACDSPNPRIEIGAEERDEEVRFYVRDSGPGIDKEYHKRIFGLFQRLDNKPEGTGVGLTIVARIMEVHGGRVWVESEPGQGATFWLAFPLAVVDSSEQQVSEARSG